MSRLDTLKAELEKTFGEKLAENQYALRELTIGFSATDYFSAMQILRDDPRFSFDTAVDLCGVDYSAYADGAWTGKRFAAVTHLLSTTHNWRLRVRVFADDPDFPDLASIVPIWAGLNWFEREAFDLVGILFDGHPDLRRILTDYGFEGHPLRKDFPVFGEVEMCYDDKEKRVKYQPVSIPPRENTPRIRRENTYGR